MSCAECQCRKAHGTGDIGSTARALIVGLLTGVITRLPDPRSEREVADLLGMPHSTVHADRESARNLIERLSHQAPGDESPADRDERTRHNASRRRRKPAKLDD